MKLYQEWRSGVGEGARLSMLQLLARADSEYKCLTQLGHLSTKHKNSDLLGLQARFETLQMQFIALATEHNKLKNKQQPKSDKPTGEPKPEENEEWIVNGEKWYYCTNCWSGRRWNKTQKSSEHKKGFNKGGSCKNDKDKETSGQANAATFEMDSVTMRIFISAKHVNYAIT